MSQLACLSLDVYCVSVKMLRDTWLFILPFTFNTVIVEELMLWGFPGGSDGKESARTMGALGLILGLGSSPGEGNGYPLQYSGLENSMDFVVHEVEKSRT